MGSTLSPTMTVRDFENGYWYLDQLKNFAVRIGIPAAKQLRKDELEKGIAVFLRTGKASSPAKRSLRKTGQKDVARGLRPRLRIEHYTSNRETKGFIIAQALKMVPDVRARSGVWYRLNRWREKQIVAGKHPTYGDLVRQYIALNKMPRFKKIPHGRYINFVADFLKAEKGATRVDAIAAWKILKKLDVPKDYRSWGQATSMNTRSNRKGSVQLARVRRICLSIPGVIERLSHGEPTFFSPKRVFAMCSNNHHNDGHVAVVLPAGPGVQQALIDESPRIFYRPPYVGAAGWIGVELAEIDDEWLGSLIREAHQLIASKDRSRRRR